MAEIFDLFSQSNIFKKFINVSSNKLKLNGGQRNYLKRYPRVPLSRLTYFKGNPKANFQKFFERIFPNNFENDFSKKKYFEMIYLVTHVLLSNQRSIKMKSTKKTF